MPTSFAPRPLSITAVGLYMLFGACLMPINISTHAPAFLLGTDFRGWPAVLFFLAIGTLDAGIGIGLLRFASWSRMAAIYFFFRILNTAITFLPSREPRAIRGRSSGGGSCFAGRGGRSASAAVVRRVAGAWRDGSGSLVSSHEQSGLRSGGRARSGFVMF